MSYTELSVEERATIQIGHAQGFSLRRIARLINRSPSTISRELRRNRDACGGYSARVAQQQMQARRQVCRPKQKLLPGSERFELVAHMLRERLSPEQIAGKLRSMNIPNLRDAYVCRETIYNAIYALPVGELRKELIICLRQGKTTLAEALEASARLHGAFQRARKIKSAVDLLGLLMSYAPGGRSLRVTAAEAAARDIAELCDVSLLERFQRCGPWLMALCTTASSHGLRQSGVSVRDSIERGANPLWPVISSINEPLVRAV